ncbi:uncharacterized protein LOC144212950 isoform X4 [Stigmatopora nigra]
MKNHILIPDEPGSYPSQSQGAWMDLDLIPANHWSDPELVANKGIQEVVHPFLWWSIKVMAKQDQRELVPLRQGWDGGGPSSFTHAS